MSWRPLSWVLLRMGFPPDSLTAAILHRRAQMQAVRSSGGGGGAMGLAEAAVARHPVAAAPTAPRPCHNHVPPAITGDQEGASEASLQVEPEAADFIAGGLPAAFAFQVTREVPEDDAANSALSGEKEKELAVVGGVVAPARQLVRFHGFSQQL